MINIKLKKYIFIIFAFILSLIFSSVGYANIATDPFITKITDKNTFEPGGRNHLFGSGRGVVSDRTGDISVVPTGNLQIGNLQIEQALIQGQYGYKTKFSGHGHEVHAPFSNSNSRNKSEEQGQALIGFTSYQMDWQGVEVHPSDGYDGPQGGGYPKPTGARDEYSYNVNGSAISVNIGFDDNRSTQDRLEDRIKAFENAWGNAKNSYDTATTNNPELTRLGNISEAISASVSGIGGLINSPLEALGASDASQGIGLARDLVALEAMRQLPHDSQMNVASGLQSANNLHQGYQNWKKENPNAAAAVNAVTGVAEQVVRGKGDKLDAVSSKDIRKGIGATTFKESRKEVLQQNNGLCEYCQNRVATQGDHIIPIKKFADAVNRKEITLEKARKQANSRENIVGSCGGKGGCNQIKGARELSSTPGKGKFVPSNPTDKIKDIINKSEQQ